MGKEGQAVLGLEVVQKQHDGAAVMGNQCHNGFVEGLQDDLVLDLQGLGVDSLQVEPGILAHKSQPLRENIEVNFLH